MRVCCVFNLRHILDILTLSEEYKAYSFPSRNTKKTTQYYSRKKIVFERSYFNYKLTEIKNHLLKYVLQSHSIKKKKKKESNINEIKLLEQQEIQFQTETVRLISSIFPTRISITVSSLPSVLLSLLPAVHAGIVQLNFIASVFFVFYS